MMDFKGTICIIDDDDAVRESLRLLLFVNGYQCQPFESADAFLAYDGPDKFEAILLDLRMPGTDGLELQQILLKRNYRTPIIFISGHGDIPDAVAAIQKGASDFLTKPFEEDDLLAKIEAAVAGFRDTRLAQPRTRCAWRRRDQPICAPRRAPGDGGCDRSCPSP